MNGLVAVTVPFSPPHVMFYAPNLSNAMIGSDGNFAPGLPSIGYQGPQGFMIVVMPACLLSQSSAHGSHEGARRIVR